MEDIVVEVVDKEEIEKGVITLSSGFQIKLNKIPYMLAADAQREMNKRKPQVPRIELEQGVTEPNPDDPTYLEDVQLWQMDSQVMQLDLIFLKSLEIIKSPPGSPKLDDEEWTEDLVAVGMTVPSKGSARRLKYLKTVVAPEISDFVDIQKEFSRVAQVTSEGVEAQANQFRR